MQPILLSCLLARCLGFTVRPASSPPPSVNSAAKPIVLVDDEKTYTDLISEFLAEALACRVHTFARPQAALRAIADIKPAIIVTDYSMPELNGIEFIRRATPLVPGTPFLMISGHDLTLQRDQLARLPALKGFLAKPFGWRKLAEEIVRIAEPANTGNRIPDSRR